MGNNVGVRHDFPILKNTDIVYLDSGATALKPKVVIDAVSDYYTNYPANVFRGLYALSAKATEKFEHARETIARLINAKSEKEIVFVRSTTEAINLVAYAWGRMNISEGDEIVTSVLEHHSNFIPWQELARENEAILKVLDIDQKGRLKTQSSKLKSTTQNAKLDLGGVITKRTKLVALTHVSNVLGTINPIKEIVGEVKRINPRCLVIVDGAQSVPHMAVNVQDIGADFYTFSGHKMMGPTGIGVLWARKDLLSTMAPFQFGGSMIESVSLEKSTYGPIPLKYEAGTPHIAGAIGMATAAEYMNEIGLDTIRNHEKKLTKYAIKKLTGLKYVSLYGPLDIKSRAGVLALNLYTGDKKLIHPHDVGDILGRESICVRVGHHCAMPLTQRLGVPATIRMSLHIYNTIHDIDRFIEGIIKAHKIFN